jgi:hypothetical protein
VFTGRLMTQVDREHEWSHCSTSAFLLSYQRQDASIVLQRLPPGFIFTVSSAAQNKHRLSQCMSLIILFEILPPVVEP